MAIKRYKLKVVDRYSVDGTGEVETHARISENTKGDLVKYEDHLDSHRFDEDAELTLAGLKFDELFLKHKNIGMLPYSFADFYAGWKACALAREKEFFG